MEHIVCTLDNVTVQLLCVVSRMWVHLEWSLQGRQMSYDICASFKIQPMRCSETQQGTLQSDFI